MDFQIAADEGMRFAPSAISLPKRLRLELNVLIGQKIQLRAGREEVILEVAREKNEEQTSALVCQEVFLKIQNSKVEVSVPEVTLGCDPEFFILWNQRRVSAATYLPFAGQVGCDGELGELRPSYGRHESQVVANLSQLIRQIPGKLKRASWAAGFPEDGRLFQYEAHSYYGNVAAGFHVHLGIPPEILNTRITFSRMAMSFIVLCLDWYVSVPLVLLEVDHHRRLGKSAYGKPGDYRPSNVTLEYRTPGAFYLRSPKLAAGLLGLSLLVTENVVARMKAASKNFVNLHKLSFEELRELIYVPNPEKVQAVLTHPNTKMAMLELGGIRKNLEALPTFGKHSQAVQEFFRAVEEQEKPGPNLVGNWKE